MPIFYPIFDPDVVQDDQDNHAEHTVLKALEADLDEQWRVFHGFNWREIDRHGERVGEADLIIFHPDLGLLVIEVKGGGVRSENGEWFYVSVFDGTERRMKAPPFEQARRNRFSLSDKLKGTSLGSDFISSTALTHTVWFPDIIWNGPIAPEVPNGAPGGWPLSVWVLQTFRTMPSMTGTSACSLIRAPGRRPSMLNQLCWT